MIRRLENEVQNHVEGTIESDAQCFHKFLRCCRTKLYFVERDVLLDVANDLLADVVCPFCKELNDSHDYELVVVGGTTLKLGICTCKKCRLNYVSRRLSQKGLSLLYDQEYIKSTVSGKYNTREEVSHAEYEAFKKYVRRYSGGAPWKLIDIGCGVGNLLAALRELPDIDVEGVEFSHFAASQAAAAGFTVQRGDFLDAVFASEMYDCITIMYVLEHVPYPFEVLKKSFYILRPGGHIMIAVPNYRYLQLVNSLSLFRFFTGRKKTMHPQEHLQNFTPATLNAMIIASGFEIVYKNIASPLKTGPWYVKFAKLFAWFLLYILFKAGYNVGGIHLIARKPECSN